MSRHGSSYLPELRERALRLVADLSWVKRLSALDPVSAGRRVGPSSRG